MGFRHLEIEQQGHVATLWLNRPEKRNALSQDLWEDIPDAVGQLDSDDGVRVVILAGRGPAFSVGIDIGMLSSLQARGGSPARANLQLYHTILELQQTATCFAEASKPVIAAIHGYCLGAGLDLISACDIRVASNDAVFSIRETRMGLVADIGSLQRLPAIIGAGALAEMAYTGADYGAEWALARGLVSELAVDRERMMDAAYAIAERIAANSPLVTSGIKRVLAASEGRTVDEALDYVAQWNSSFLLSDDLEEAVAAFLEKRDPDFTGS